MFTKYCFIGHGLYTVLRDLEQTKDMSVCFMTEEVYLTVENVKNKQ